MSKDEEQTLMDSKKKVNIEPTGAPAVPSDTAPETDTQAHHAALPEPSKPEESVTAPIVPDPVKDEEFPTDGLASVATGSVVDAGQDKMPTESDTAKDESSQTPADTPRETDTAAAFPAADLDELAKQTEDAEADKTPAADTEATLSADQPAEPTPPRAPYDPSQTSGVVFEDSPAHQPPKPDPNAEPLPVLHEDDPMQKMIVSHHTERASSAMGIVLTIIALVILGVAVFNVLLDAGIFVIDGIPHTDFF